MPANVAERRKAGKSLVAPSRGPGEEFHFSYKDLREVLEGGLSVGVASLISTAWRGEEQPCKRGAEHRVGGPGAGGWSRGRWDGEKRVDSRPCDGTVLLTGASSLKERPIFWMDCERGREVEGTHDGSSSSATLHPLPCHWLRQAMWPSLMSRVGFL